MIKTRKELKEYIDADRIFYPKLSSGLLKRLKNRLVTSSVTSEWKIYSYIRSLRHADFHLNNSLLSLPISPNSVYHTIILFYWYWQLRLISSKTGFQISPNSFGKGLRIFHYGSIIVNEKARIGDYATIFPQTLIGAKPNGVPTIGHHVMICAGAKVLGGGICGELCNYSPKCSRGERCAGLCYCCRSSS